MRFYLGVHHPDWLKKVKCPLFISRRTLINVSSNLEPKCQWSLDSGGFTELSQYGGWTIDFKQYAREVIRWYYCIGNLDFVCIQDWMCEDFILQKTKLSVRKHQERTVQNYIDLKSLVPEIPWLPIIQGFHEYQYRECIRLYESYGIDLQKENLVGIGSICRRQGTQEAEDIIRRLSKEGIRLHAFGMKITGLKKIHSFLSSSDSMAWSFAARKEPPLDGCVGHKRCNNCLKYALIWREKIIEIIS